MALVPESIPASPTPDSKLLISQTYKQGYASVLKLDDDSMVPSDEHLKGITEEIFATGAVDKQLVVQNYFGAASVDTEAAEAWFYGNGAAAATRELAVPSLAELGIDNDNYKVEAKTVLVVNDSNDTGDIINTRLIHTFDDSVVSGSEASQALDDTDDKDQKVESDWFEIPTNTCFFIDFQKMDDNAVDVVLAKRMVLHIRTVRR